MNTLVIFDDSVRPERIPVSVWRGGGKICLFPLVTNQANVRRLKSFLESTVAASVEVLESGRLVDFQIKELCAKIPRWSAEKGMLRIGRKTVREHFLLPGEKASSFWFGSIAEKNPLKTDLFLLLAQAEAVGHLLEKGGLARVVICVASRPLRASLRNLAEEHRIPVEMLPARPSLRWLQRPIGMIGNAVLGVAGLAQMIFRAILARVAMGPLSRTAPPKNALLFVTYFPYVDEAAALQGIFRNNYCKALQRACEEEGQEIFWFLIFVYVGEGSFLEALRLARRFANNGVKLAFAEEYFGIKEILAVWFLWLRQFVKFLAIRSRPGSCALYEGLGSKASAPVLRALWLRSVLGLEAVRGLFFYVVSRRMLRSKASFARCLYYFEMQSWEKALLSAVQEVRPGLDTIGYQHTAVSRRYPFFRHAPSDVSSSCEAGGLPLPRIIACNGRVAHEQFEGCGYSNLFEVEALRQLPFVEYLRRPLPVRKGPLTLLVAGSIIREETLALLSFLYDAMPLPRHCEVWLKGHPSMPMESLLEELSIDPAPVGWVVKNGDIHTHLEKAHLVLVGTSTVAIEALAFGCEVLVPAVAAFFSMSPLDGFEGYYRKLYCPSGLSDAVGDYCRNGPSLDVAAKRAFVRRYWNLDESIPQWRNLLGLRSPVLNKG